MVRSGTWAVLLALAAGAASADTAPAPPPAPDPGQPLVGFGSPALGAPGGLAGAAAAPLRPISLSAYFILGGQWVQQDPNYLGVGRNNGFNLGDARLEITGKPADNFWLYLSFDGAVTSRSAADPLKGTRTTELKDAYGVFSPGWHLRLQGGQFKAPQDVENLLEETEIKFPSRSIVTNGVSPPAGYLQDGLALGRQVGLAVGTDAIPLPFGSVAAQVAVTNGNGPNQLFNDTNIPSVSGRVSLGILGIASVGADAYYQARASGTLPDLFRDDLTGFGADLRVTKGPAHLMALVQTRTTKHVTTGAPDESSLGWSAEAAWMFFGFLEPAVRYSVLDPNDKVPANKVSEFSAALNVYSFGVLGQGVARLSLAYVHRGEEPARSLQNDGLDLAAQVRF